MMRHRGCAQRIGFIERDFYWFFFMVTEEPNIRKREVYGNILLPAGGGQSADKMDRTRDAVPVRNSGRRCSFCFDEVPLQKNANGLCNLHKK